MKKSLLLIAFFGMILSGCGSSRSENGVSHDLATEEYAAVEDENTASQATFVPVNEAPEAKKIIKTGRMGIRVSRIDESKRRVDSLVARYQGYYAEENSSNGYRSGLTMTIRVPFGHFDAFTAALETGKGEVLYKNISARDVGEEYLDTETRLANKRSYLERYRELLKRANTIREILEVEQYIRRLEEEIESAQGRLRYLDNQTAYSTLELTLSTEQTAAPLRDTFWNRAKRALSMGWDGITAFVIGLLHLWPFLLIGFGVWYGVRLRIKRRKGQK